VPAVVTASLLAALSILVALLNRGFNLLDEAYYVQWIGSPERYEFSIHPFGLFFHAFFDLLQNSIVALRAFGVFLLAGSGALLGWSIARYCRLVLKLDAATKTFAALGALFQLTYYVLWIPTPSYNLLANVGAAMIFAGCLGWLTTEPEVRNKRIDRLCSVIVGLGGCYAFFGKPTFAALGAAVVFLVLVRSAMTRNWGVLVERAFISGASCLVPLYLHITYAMPFSAFVNTVEGGMAALNYGNSLADLPIKTFKELKSAPRLLLLSGLAALAAAGWRMWRPSYRSRAIEWAAVALVAVNAWYLGAAIGSVLFEDRVYWDAFGPELEALVLAQITYGLARRSSEPLDPRGVGLMLALLALPFAVAFGTANPLVRQISISMFGAMFASAVAALILFRKTTAQLTQCALAIIALAAVVGAAVYPYRLPRDLSRQSEPLTIPMFQGRLLVDDVTKRYAVYLKSVGQRGALAPDVPVLDLSGGGPGTALYLGGRPPGNPWLIQFFDNAAPMADAFWSTLTRVDRARTWVIGPIHPKFSGSEVAKQITAQKSRYACIGRSSMPFWGEPMPVSVWKPATEEATTAPAPAECAGAELAVSPPG
jgi:hypothetical protein